MVMRESVLPASIPCPFVLAGDTVGALQEFNKLRGGIEGSGKSIPVNYAD